MAEMKNTANVAMIETAVEDGQRPNEERERHERRDPEQDDSRREEEARVHEMRLPDDEEPHRSEKVDDVRGRKEHSPDVAREEKRHAADGARKVEVDRALLHEARDEVRGREDREERPDDVEEAREARLETEDELVEVHALTPHLDVLAEDLRARERAVHDVGVHGDREDQDEERRQREVRDKRPARGRFAEDFFDVRGEGSHDTCSGVAFTRSTNLCL